MATFTMSHTLYNALLDLWDRLSAAWRGMTSKRAWKKTRKEIGCDHYIRAVEVTHGANGWHVHIHLVMLFDGPVDRAAVERLEAALYVAWSREVSAQGLRASREHGVDVRVCGGASASAERLGAYLTKMTYEAVGGAFKGARGGSRTAFEILRDAIETGRADDWELWWEWERASKGRHQLHCSRGLKAAAGVDEVSDEEVAAEEWDGETWVILPPGTWRGMRREAIELLEAAEDGGVEGAMIWLDDRGWAYEVPDVIPRVRE